MKYVEGDSLSISYFGNRIERNKKSMWWWRYEMHCYFGTLKTKSFGIQAKK